MKLSDKASPSAPALSVCVYCGALSGHHPNYLMAARQVGEWLGQHQIGLVYGGGSHGLMGEVAHAALAHGGYVTGIIPQRLVEKEQALRACSELHIVDTMHQRKQMMAMRADAFLALPGGLGTLEELFEVWTWRYLGHHHKPLGLLNVDGYYEHLLQFLHHGHQQGFVRDTQMQMLLHDSDAASMLHKLHQAMTGCTAP